MALSYTPAILQPGLALGAASGLIVPVSQQRAVLRAVAFCNTALAVVPITVQIQRQGAANPLTIISGLQLQPNQTYVAHELLNKVLAAGDTLVGFAGTAAAVNAFVDGLLF